MSALQNYFVPICPCFLQNILVLLKFQVHNYTKLLTNNIKTTYFIAKYMIKTYLLQNHMQNIPNVSYTQMF